MYIINTEQNKIELILNKIDLFGEIFELLKKEKRVCWSSFSF